MGLTCRLAVLAGAAAVAAGAQLGAFQSKKDIDSDSVKFTTVNNETVQVDFLRDDVFRIWASAPGEPLQDELVDAEKDQGAYFGHNVRDRIVVKADYALLTVPFVDKGTSFEATTGKVTLRVNKSPLSFECLDSSTNTPVWRELRPIDIGSQTSQELFSSEDEQFYGGGQQNGNIAFKEKIMKIGYSGGWDENDRPSPAPFYVSSKGYGVLRNTWRDGEYSFEPVTSYTTTHKEKRFDAYYFIGDIKTVVNRYTELTGRPHVVPRWGFYLGDADCYNDGDNKAKPGTYPAGWTDGPTGMTIDVIESVGQKYVEHDMPVGWVLPNDGYGCGYTNLSYVSSELMKRGIKTGLWTQKGVDRIKQEVADGIRVMKLDVAWTGPGKLYSMVAQKQAHDGLVSNAETRGMVWTVMGWAGMQRYSVAWTGDQSGSFDYVRWHIPTFVGSGLSGQAYASSDVNGIFGGNFESFTRDIQFKTFTPVLIAMSGWASQERKHPWWFEEPYRSVNRDFLKLKSAMIPYVYAFAHEAEETGAPITRAMMWEFPQYSVFTDETYKYQYMFGTHLLVAPVYTPLSQSTWSKGIFLPEGTWFDFFNGIRTNVVAKGGAEVKVPVTLETIPVFVRAGAIVPMYKPARTDDLQPKDYVEIHVWPYGESTFTLVEDDGETYRYRNGKTARTTIKVSAGTNQVQDVKIDVGATAGSYDGMPTERTIKFIVHTQLQPKGVTVDGVSAEFTYDPNNAYGTVEVEVKGVSVSKSVSVVVDLDENAPVPTTPQYGEAPPVSNFRKEKVKIVKRPAEHPGWGIERAWDGKMDTTYISPYGSKKPEDQAPTDFVVDLSYNYEIYDLIYTPQAADWAYGVCGKYEIWVGDSATEFPQTPTIKGEWDMASFESKTAKFNPPAKGRYLKFRYVTGSNNHAQAAEFDLVAIGEFPKPVSQPITKGMAAVNGKRSYDVSLTGTPLTMNGLKFAKGVHVSGTAGVCMGLEGEWEMFTADVGIDDSCKVAGNRVQAAVLVDGVSKWSWDISGPTVVKPKVSLAGAKTLSLVAYDNDGSSVGDCVNWANPTLTGMPGAKVTPRKCSCTSNWQAGGFDSTQVNILESPPEQPGEGFALAWDGDSQSKYHSPWFPKDASEKVPLSFVVDLGATLDVNGLGYLPRQDGSNGRVKSYSLYLSNTSPTSQWVKVASGTWNSNNATRQTADILNGPIKTRYLKFTAETSVGNFFSAAEFDVIVGALDCPVDTKAPVVTCPPTVFGPSDMNITGWPAILKTTDETELQIATNFPSNRVVPCGGTHTFSFTAVDEFELSTTCSANVTLACGANGFFSTPTTTTRQGAEQLCGKFQLALADVDSKNVVTLKSSHAAGSFTSKMPGGSTTPKTNSYWVKSWNKDTYSGAPLQITFPQAAITLATQTATRNAMCVKTKEAVITVA